MIDTARTVCLCIAMLVLSAACSTRTDAGTDPLTKRGCSSAQSEVPAPSTALSVVPPPPTSLTYAEVCATYDPVNHPEQVQKILEYASGVTGTPVDVLFAVWWKETKQLGGAGRASGGCPVMAELKLRDAAAGEVDDQSLDDGHVAHLQHGLRDRVGEWPESGAEPSDQHDRAHQPPVVSVATVVVV